MLILVGLPGSGKSSLAARLAGKGYDVVNQDTMGDRNLAVCYFDVCLLQIVGQLPLYLEVCLYISACVYTIYIYHIRDDMPRLGWKTPRQVLRPSCQRCFGGKSPAGCGSMQLHQTPKTSPSETERDLGGDPWPHWLYNDHFCPKDLKWYQFLDASWVMKDTPIVFLFDVSDLTDLISRSQGLAGACKGLWGWSSNWAAKASIWNWNAVSLAFHSNVAPVAPRSKACIWLDIPEASSACWCMLHRLSSQP